MVKKWLFIVLSFLVVAGIYIATTQQDHSSNVVVQKKSNTQSFNKHANSITDPNSIWVVVNKTHPLKPIDYAPPDLVSVSDGQELRQPAANALTALFKDASKQGITLIAASAYRSYQMQVDVYNSEVQGLGQQAADLESAKPGYSEHQTGLAVDVGGGGCNIDDCFANTKEGQWVAANAYKYGFLLRYPADKVSTTGYRYEPWHLRYIGTELSNELHKEKIETLEEFFNLK